MDSFKNFSENKLPDRSQFYNSLQDECINENEVIRWLSWSLLEDRCFIISWCFWKVYWYVLKIYYGLDSCYYFSSPGLSWGAMLKMTKI